MANYVLDIIEMMQNKHNFNLSVFEKVFLEKIIDTRMHETCQVEYLQYLTLLETSHEEAQKLNSALQITYSQFFRDSLTFANLENTVLAAIVNGYSENYEIRIWSVGCSTGQEAYSVAILMSELSLQLGRNIRYRIIATDISEEALRIAREGRYCHGAMLNLKMKHIETYFEKKDNVYAISSDIKSHIVFINYDLLDKRTLNPPDSIYGDFNLILCCNLLIYFNRQSQRNSLEKLKRTLVPKGYLVVSEVEKSILIDDQSVCPVNVDSSIFQNLRRRQAT